MILIKLANGNLHYNNGTNKTYISLLKEPFVVEEMTMTNTLDTYSKALCPERKPMNREEYGTHLLHEG